jgi:hypothetical protein
MEISLHHLREHRLVAMAPGAEANPQPSAAELAETKTEKQNAPKGSVDARAADAATTAGKAAETTGKSALAAHETAKGAGADGPETRPAMEGVAQALKLPATPDQKPGTEVSIPIKIIGSTAAPEQTISLPDYVALTRKADAQIQKNVAAETGKPKIADAAATAKNVDTQMKKDAAAEAGKPNIPDVTATAQKVDAQMKKAGADEAAKVKSMPGFVKSEAPDLTNPLGKDKVVVGKVDTPVAAGEKGGATPERGPKSPEQIALDTAKIDFKKALPSQLMEQGQKFLDSIKTPKDAEAVIQLAQHLAGKETNAKKMMFLRRKTEPKAEEDKEAWNTLQRLFKPVMPTETGGNEKTNKSSDEGQTDKPTDKEKGEQLSPKELETIRGQGLDLIKEFNAKQLTPEARQKEQGKYEGRLQMLGIDPSTMSFDPPGRAEALQGDEFQRGMNKFMGMIKYFMEALDTKKKTKDEEKKTTDKKETKADAPAAKPAEGTPGAPTAKPAEAGTPKTAEKTSAAEPKGPENKDAKTTPEKPTENIQDLKGNVEARLRDTLKNFASDPKTAELAARFVSIKAENGTYQVFLDEKAAQNNGVSPENIAKFSSAICSMDTRDMNSGVSKTEPMTEKDFRNYAEQLTMRIGADLSNNLEGALKTVRGDKPDTKVPSFVKVSKLPNGKYQVSVDSAAAGNNVSADVLAKLNATCVKNGINQQHLKQGTVTGEFDEKQLWDLASNLRTTKEQEKTKSEQTLAALNAQAAMI